MKSPYGTPRLQAWTAIILIVCAVAFWLMYSQATGLTWQFDDRINLKGIAGASDWQGLLDFVLGGIAGPSGRPLSLLSFVADYGDWPGNPWGVVRRTLLLHLVNAGLVFLLTRTLLSQLATWRDDALPLAALTAGIWMLMPIHASGMLMPVQRMTTLSGFFMLATLLTYAWLRIRLAGREGFAPLAIIVLACATGLVLAVFSKETGALLLVFVPLLEWFFFARHAPVGPKVAWKIGIWGSFLALPAYLAWYTVTRWSYLNGSVTYQRGFDLSERLASETVILWEYLRQILAPRAALLGPFHDGHVVLDWSHWLPWFALLAWIGLAAAVVCWGRSASALGRLAAFALAFYLGGHLLESTVIPVELYFEHRNYLASLGIALFLVLATATALRQPAQRRIATLVGVVLSAFSLFALQQTTSLWGKPFLAAQVWARAQPDSTRAIQYLAWVYKMGGDDQAGRSVLDRFAASHPGALDVRIQAMASACSVEDAPSITRRFGDLVAAVPMLGNPAGITTGISDLGSAILSDQCHPITAEEYRNFLIQLLSSPRIENVHRVRHHVYHQLASVAAHAGDITQRIDYLKEAFRDFPSYSGAKVVALLLFQEGRNGEAIAWIDSARQAAPNSIAGRSWQKSLASLRSAIDEVERMHRAYNMEYIKSPGE